MLRRRRIGTKRYGSFNRCTGLIVDVLLGVEADMPESRSGFDDPTWSSYHRVRVNRVGCHQPGFVGLVSFVTLPDRIVMKK